MPARTTREKERRAKRTGAAPPVREEARLANARSPHGAKKPSAQGSFAQFPGRRVSRKAPPGAGALKAPRSAAAYRAEVRPPLDRPAWILVADSERARLFDARRIDGEWSLRMDYRHVESRLKWGSLLTDRPGGRIAQKGTTPKDLEATRFAKHLAEVLDQGFATGGYRDLVLVGPAKFLGLLRRMLKPIARREVRLVERDYVYVPDRDVPARVADQLS